MNQTHRDSAPFLITMGIWFILAAFLGAQAVNIVWTLLLAYLLFGGVIFPLPVIK